MALPKHIHELLMTTQPEMVKLETDDLLQLIAFLKHPQDASFDVNRMWAEEDRGILTYRREIDQRDEFQKHCQRVRDYNILRREAVAALPSVPKPKMLVVRSWAELGIGIADTDPIAFIPAPGLGERVKKTSGHPLALPGNRWPALFRRACSASDGQTVGKRDLEKELSDATNRRKSGSSNYTATAQEGLTVHNRNPKTFTDTLADLRRELRDLVDGPDNGLIVDLGQQIFMGFIVQGLIEDEKRHFTFGLTRGK